MKPRVVAAVAALALVVVVVGVALARRDDGRHTPPRLPIAISRGAGGADAALAPYGQIAYHAGPNLAALDGSGRAYRVRGVDADSTARRLADALGLHGQPVDNGAGTRALSENTAQLLVTGRDWSYARDPGGAISSGVAVACPPDAAKCVPGDTVPPTPPPANLPSADDAKAAALGLLARAGFDTTGAAVTIDDGVTQWFVTVQPVIDGMATEGFSYSVVVGDSGAIDAANGILGAPVPVDDYPLIGTLAAIDRINAGDVYGRPGPLSAATANANDRVAPENAASAQAAAPTAVPIPSEPPAPSSEPPATDTVLPPTTQDVTLNRVDRVLLYVTGDDGEGWLLPAYRFGTADGPGPSVVAVDDRFLASPAAVTPAVAPGVASAAPAAPAVTAGSGR